MIDVNTYLAGKAPNSVATCVTTSYEDVQTHPIHLRFELHPAPETRDAMADKEQPKDKTTRIIEHATARATQIFESIVRADDELVLLIKDWRPDASEDYVHTLVSPTVRQAMRVERIRRWQPNCPEPKGVQWCIPARREDIQYREMLAGIVRCDWGRQPLISQRVFFINVSRDIVFYLYDDRGCLAFSVNPEKLMFLYEQFKSWIIAGFLGSPGLWESAKRRKR